MQQHLPILREIYKVLTAERVHESELAQTIKNYRNLLIDLSPMNFSTEASELDIHLVNGKAIGSTWAATCLDGAIRTQRFVKGISEAIKNLQTVKKKPIHILYAGSGPFATLILPILAVSSETEIQVSLLEINAESFANVQQVFNQLNFDKFINTFANADATTYQIPNGESVDILVSETMLHSLKEEPQVSIVINLMSQLRQDVILIPENIILEIGLLHPREITTEENFKKLATIFELKKEKLPDFKVTKQEDSQIVAFPKVTVNLPPKWLQHYHQLAIFTEIQVYQQYWIRTDENGLTTPWIIENTSQFENKETAITLQYKIDSNPGIMYTFDSKKIS